MSSPAASYSDANVVRRREARRAERLEGGPLRRLAGDGERAERAAVERAFEREHAGLAGRLARVLERGLVRLGAGIAEERLRAAEAVGEDRGQLGGRLARIEVGRVPEPVELRVRGRERRRMAVPERDDGDAGGEVEIAAPVGPGEPDAVALDEADLRLGVRRQQMRLDRDAHATTAVAPMSACRPLRAARDAARSLGTMPPSKVPLADERLGFARRGSSAAGGPRGRRRARR